MTKNSNLFFTIVRRRQNLLDERSYDAMRCVVVFVFFISGLSGVLVNARGNVDRSARNQGHNKRGEIWMSLITCGSIHEGHE